MRQPGKTMRPFGFGRSARSALLTAAVTMLIVAGGGEGAASGAKQPEGPMPDGRYRCMLSFSTMLGDMLIEAGTYRGPSADPAAESASAFELRPDGTIIWSGPLPAIREEGLKVVSSELVDKRGVFPGFSMDVVTEGNVRHAISCEPLK